jgi:hypothetical protein
MTTDEHLGKIVARCLRVPHAYPGDRQAVAMAQSTIVAIEGLRLIANQGSHPESSSAKCDLHKIINLWPEELL